MGRPKGSKNKIQSGAGGARKGAGRKPKIEEHKLIEKLHKAVDEEAALSILNGLIMEGDFKALALYMNYMYGKPKEKMDVTSGGDKILTPVINMNEWK